MADLQFGYLGGFTLGVPVPGHIAPFVTLWGTDGSFNINRWFRAACRSGIVTLLFAGVADGEIAC